MVVFTIGDSGDTTTANNGGTVIVASDNARWKLELNGEPVNAMQFGAKNDGTTDSTTFVQAAIDAARLSTSKVVRITGRIYCASDIDYSGVKLSGDCAGWVAGSGMDAVEDYPSIMLLGSNSLDATPMAVALWNNPVCCAEKHCKRRNVSAAVGKRHSGR